MKMTSDRFKVVYRTRNWDNVSHVIRLLIVAEGDGKIVYSFANHEDTVDIYL